MLESRVAESQKEFRIVILRVENDGRLVLVAANELAERTSCNYLYVNG